MVKLLHLISSMDPRSGGPCQGIRNLAPQAPANGSTVEVVCLDSPRSDYLSEENLRIHALGPAPGRWAYHSALRPWLEANRSRFDAIILNGLWQYTGFALARAARQPKFPPYFVFPHGMLDPWFQNAPGRRLKAIRNWLYWKLVEQEVIRNAKAILFTCAEEMRLAAETFRPYRPRHQLNVGFGAARPPERGISMAAACMRKCPGYMGQPYFLFLGRIHPKKGVDILIRAYANFFHSTPSSQYARPPCLIIAGPGLDTSFGRQMQGLAANLCPTNSVIWPGMLTGDAKWGALYDAEAFVLTSHQENFGIAVVEALGCGTPVLISSQINIWREIVADGAGLVAVNTLSGAVSLFQNWGDLSSAQKAKMRGAAKACYDNRFGVEPAARSLHSTIQRLIVPPQQLTVPVEREHLVAG